MSTLLRHIDVRRSAWTVAALAGVAGSVVAPWATSPAAAETAIEVEVGYAGHFRIGRPVPVRVRVEADRLLRTTLEIEPRQDGPQAVTLNLPIEVPGGSVKEFVAVLPGAWYTDRVEVSVRLDGDSGGASGRGTARAVEDSELVGLLPTLASTGRLPGETPLAIDAGTARFTALGEADLAAAPGSIGALDVLAATAQDLTDLDTATAEAVLAWVEEGGHLLVDVPRGERVPAIPARWQPGADGRARAGLGEVRVTGSAMTEGRWAGLVEPTPLTGATEQGYSGEPVESALARDAGLRLPRLGWLGAFLVVYVLTIPLTLFVLRRLGRGELGWIVVPALALAFTAGAWTFGRGIRDDTGAAHATVVRAGESGAWAYSTFGLVSRNGGTERVQLPPRWAVGASSPFGTMSSAPVEVTLERGRVASRQRLQAGEFAIQTGSGPVAVAGGLHVDARATADDELRGTIENRLPYDLEEVAVITERSAELLGDVAAGASLDWKLETGPPAGDPWMSVADRAWPRASGMRGPPDPGYIANSAMWATFATGMPSGFAESGSVVVAGWTREFVPGAAVPRGELTGRTLVLASVPVSASGPMRSTAVATQRVRSAFSRMMGVDESRPSVTRFVLPDVDDGAELPAGLALRGPTRGISYELWRDGAWQPLDTAGAVPLPGVRGLEPLGPLAEIALPAGSVRDGVVWLRHRVRSGDGVDPWMLTVVNVFSLRAAP